MEETKIGTIVRPKTPMWYKEFGNGIVTGTTEQKIQIVFLRQGSAFDIKEFKPIHIEPSKVGLREQRRLENIAKTYKELKSEL